MDISKTYPINKTVHPLTFDELTYIFRYGKFKLEKNRWINHTTSATVKLLPPIKIKSLVSAFSIAVS